MQRTKWLDRKYNFDFPAGLMENITARLAGTISRLDNLVLELTDDELKQQLDGKWSVKEHLGHLAATELLHIGRIDDLIAKKEVLRPALFRKPDTDTVDYNNVNTGELLTRFEANRKRFVLQLEELSDEIQNSVSLHPRLNTMMRPVDVAYFAAEHDDHHIAYIREIIKTLSFS